MCPTPSFLTVCACAALAANLAGAPQEHRVAWTSDAIELVGTLTLPEGAGPHPLAIFVPGSGCIPRDSHPMKEHSRRLGQMGLAAFVFDKRGCGDSGGDWRKVGLVPLADDVRGAIGRLAEDSRIDAGRIGLMGLSQGAWVSLIAAERDKRVSWLIWLSGPPMTPAQQGAEILRMRMEARGWNNDAIAEALELDAAVINVYRTQTGWDEVAAKIDAARGKPWFRDADLGLQPRESWNWRWYASFFDYDPIPALRTQATPLLAIYGSQDQIVPPDASRRAIDKLAESAPTARVTCVLGGVGHDLGGTNAAWPVEYWNQIRSFLTSCGVVR